MRLRLWGGQLVRATILKKRWLLVLVAWEVRSWSWYDTDPPYIDYTKTAWRPVWRLVPYRDSKETDDACGRG